MNGGKTVTTQLQSKGEDPAIVEYFCIEGLHDFQTVAFSSKRAATILIARNGSGKTTLLGALDAFLKRQFFRLKDLKFKRIICKLSSVDRELVLQRDDLSALADVPSDPELTRLSQRSEISEKDIYQFILGEWNYLRENITPRDHPLLNTFWRSTDYDFAAVERLLDEASARLLSNVQPIGDLISQLNQVLGKFEIVYLPTYRRIELALEKNEENARGRRSPNFNFASGGLFSGDIRFGLSDIAERLSQLNSQIVSESSFGYRKLSANIINDILDGDFQERLNVAKSTPATGDLKLFFSRLETARQVGPYFPVRIPDFEKLERNKNLDGDGGRFLNYFLNQLGEVINSTKEIEHSVEQFVSSCNKYLMSEDDIAVPTDSMNGVTVRQVDGKILQLNRADLSVFVETLSGKRRIPLDALSSGEKQMISLFAKLYLYPPRKKLVLIDEPELSLSLDWQRSILVDVLNAPLCSQIVAITHSPFIFDNELEPFARSMKIETTVTQNPEEFSVT